MENIKNDIKIIIRNTIFVQGIIFLISGTIWAIDGNLDKWFVRWALGMILLSAYGIMKHLDHNE